MTKQRTETVTSFNEPEVGREARLLHEKRGAGFRAAMIELPMRERIGLIKSIIVHGAPGVAKGLVIIGTLLAAAGAYNVLGTTQYQDQAHFHDVAKKFFMVAGAFFAGAVPPGIIAKFTDRAETPRPSEIIAAHNQKYALIRTSYERPVDPRPLFERMRDMPRGTGTGGPANPNGPK